MIRVVSDTHGAVGSSDTLHAGATCVRVSQNASTLTCGTASYGSVGSGAATVNSGLTENVVETFGTGSVSGQITATTYSGSALALVQAPNGSTAWSLSGGTPDGSLSGTASVTFNGSRATSGTISMSDATAGVVITGTLANGALHLALAHGSTNVASADVDNDGNGTVSYADGTTNVVAGFTITQ